jgi:hypothetical protein
VTYGCHKQTRDAVAECVKEVVDARLQARNAETLRRLKLAEK